ncbi:hypothetical protein QWY74_07340 [Halomonas almeriensis]|nr:hypothetical protein [Halomonas almeriensis]
MRQAMGPMDRASRADLAARIDDALATAETDQQGREKVLALVGGGKPQGANHSATTRPGWLEWMADQCPLAPEDKAHIQSGLSRVHPRMQQRLAERYVQTWREAAEQEPSPPKRENAGRRAANLFITRLLADASIQP